MSLLRKPNSAATPVMKTKKTVKNIIPVNLFVLMPAFPFFRQFFFPLE